MLLWLFIWNEKNWWFWYWIFRLLSFLRIHLLKLNMLLLRFMISMYPPFKVYCPWDPLHQQSLNLFIFVSQFLSNINRQNPKKLFLINSHFLSHLTKRMKINSFSFDIVCQMIEAYPTESSTDKTRMQNIKCI